MSNRWRSPNRLNLTDQASRIIAKFGTVRLLADALAALDDASQARSLATIYKWTWARHRGGTGGMIPARNLNAIIQAARNEGILLTPDDLYGVLG